MACRRQGDKVQSLGETPGEVLSVVNQPCKSDESRETQTESLSSFMEATTLHGARFLFTGNVFRRLLWALSLISCFIVCIYQVYQTVDAFDNRPFNTKMTTKTPNKNHLPFPAVTLCNFNFFNRRRYTQMMSRNNLSSDVIERNLDTFVEMMTGSKAFFTNRSKQQNAYLFLRQYGEVQVSNHYLAMFSHLIEEMLLPSPIFESCDINGINCGPKNFTSFVSSVFGQCYTFNSGKVHHPTIKATMAGHLNGLKLLLNIEKNSYLDNAVNPFAGLTVLVHDQQTLPFMEQFGFAVRPGVRTLCAIKRKKVW